jgi:ankyrin repeat protein
MKDKHQRPSSAAKERTNPSAQAACLAAVQRGALERVSALLREGVAVNWQDKDGCSLIFHAIFRRHFAIAEELLARGANIDLTDRRGWTPLFWAAFNGHTDIVGFLVAHRADANMATHEGDRPLFMAAYKGHIETVRLLLAGGAQWDAIDPVRAVMLYGWPA